jgi:integrase
MSRLPKPFTVLRRGDSKTFQLTLNPTCGIPAQICREWQRVSFQNFPNALVQYRNPKNKSAAETGVYALIQYLKNELAQGDIPHTAIKDITVGVWLKKFITLAENPRASRNLAKNRPYSVKTIAGYESYYRMHLKNDPFMDLKMSEADKTDVLEFISRMGSRRLTNGQKMLGNYTFAGVLKFVRMTFNEYRKSHTKWMNPFQSIETLKLVKKSSRDALSEDEVVALFAPGVLNDPMELAVCAAMFLAGLRRAEIFALKPECLDWHTPKIIVRNAWQNFDSKNRILGPPKGKRERDAPFDPILQESIKKLWN